MTKRQSRLWLESLSLFGGLYQVNLYRHREMELDADFPAVFQRAIEEESSLQQSGMPPQRI